jgi:hypothetical protein
MTILRRAIAVCGFASLVLAPTAAFAIGHGTPDESPPAEEAVCDESGLIGAAFGLCIAFCEANDCDQFPSKNGNKKACESLRANYTRITGELAFPCEETAPPGDA